MRHTKTQELRYFGTSGRKWHDFISLLIISQEFEPRPQSSLSQQQHGSDRQN